MTSAQTSPKLRVIIEGLLRAEPGYRLLASEACFRFFEAVEEESRAFDLTWLPAPELTPFSSGVYDLGSSPPDVLEPVIEAPTPVGTATANPTREFNPPTQLGGQFYDDHEPARSRVGLGIGLLVAGVAAAALVYMVTSREVPNEPVEVAAVAAAPTRADASGPVVPAPAASAEPAGTNTAEGADKPEGNPIVWLAAVNRTDLGAVLPLEERKSLLEELAARGRIHERVNHRWNAMLDLWQAKEAEYPCATFAAALATLDSPPHGDLEDDLLQRVVVPVVA